MQSKLLNIIHFLTVANIKVYFKLLTQVLNFTFFDFSNSLFNISCYKISRWIVKLHRKITRTFYKITEYSPCQIWKCLNYSSTNSKQKIFLNFSWFSFGKVDVISLKICIKNFLYITKEFRVHRKYSQYIKIVMKLNLTFLNTNSK